MHICPHCRQELTVTPTQHGRIYACATCGGRAVGLPVLRKVASRTAIRQLLLQTSEGPKGTGVACPVCHRKTMAARAPVGDASVEVDICRSCQFIWLDRYEMERLPPRTADEDDPAARVKSLPPKVRERLAVMEIEHQAEMERLKSSLPETGDQPDLLWQWIPGILGLPVEVENPVGIRPWLTWSLSAAIFLAFVLTWTNLEQAVADFGLIPNQLGRYGGLTLVTSFFLHAGLLHLIGNLYFLLIFGDNVEENLGPLRTAALLLAATIAGGLAHVMLEPNSAIPCVGASGGISGVIAFYALRFPRAKLGIFFAHWVLIRHGFYRWFFFPAWLAFGLWMMLQLFLGWLQLNDATNVSAAAHLGGAAVGVVTWLWVEWGWPAR